MYVPSDSAVLATKMATQIILETLLAMMLGIIGASLNAPKLKEITWASEMRKQWVSWLTHIHAHEPFSKIDEMDSRLGFANYVSRGKILFNSVGNRKQIEWFVRSASRKWPLSCKQDFRIWSPLLVSGWSDCVFRSFKKFFCLQDYARRICLHCLETGDHSSPPSLSHIIIQTRLFLCIPGFSRLYITGSAPDNFFSSHYESGPLVDPSQKYF